MVPVMTNTDVLQKTRSEPIIIGKMYTDVILGATDGCVEFLGRFFNPSYRVAPITITFVFSPFDTHHHLLIVVITVTCRFCLTLSHQHSRNEHSSSYPSHGATRKQSKNVWLHHHELWSTRRRRRAIEIGDWWW
jgi:hypothetical protein